MKIRSFAVAALAAFILGSAQASLVPTAPADYAIVPLLSDGMKAWKTKTFAEQKSASATKETTARYNTEKDYAANSLPVRISWSGGAAPYAVRVVTSHGGRLFYEGPVSDTHVDLMNLEVGRNYTWTVTSGSDKAEGHFFTEPDAPRAINKAECVISNVRDLGGWMTEDGKVVKQGMVYRSESFDYYTPTNPDADPTNPDHDEWTAEVTPVFQRFWNDKARIKTEIDLREKGDLVDAREEYGFADSVISNAHVVISEDICGLTFNEACYYNAFTTANGKKAMLSIITNFANSASYPILFHCRYGKDRTGTLALILNALLGVPEDSLRDDYAFTYYAVAEHKANSNFDSVSTMFTKLSAFAGDTLKEKTAAYLLSIGVTQTQIDAIRANLLEDPESPDVKPETDEFAYKDYYFRRAGWGGSWNSDSIYWYKTKTGTTKAFKSTDDPCYPKGADAAVWFYPYGSQNKYAFPVGIGQAATPAQLGRIVTDNTYGSPDSEIGFNSLNAVFSNVGHSVNDRAFWEHVNGVGMADVVRFFFDGAANNTYSLTMHPNTEMIFQFLTCYGTTSGALYTSNLSTSSTHANFKSSPAYLKFLPGGDQTVRVTEDGDTHLYSKIGWFTGGDVRSTQTFIFENAFLELTNDNHDNAVLGKLAFDFRLGDYVTTSTALAMLRARGALTINPGSMLKVDAGQKTVGKYKLISSVKSLTCDTSFYTAAEISNLAAGTGATVTREGNTLYLTVETAAQPLEPADPDDLVMVEYIENAYDAYVDTMIPIQDKLVASVDHAYTGFNEKGSYMLAANGLVAGKSDAREYFASVGSTGSWRVGLGQNSLVTILTSDIPAAVLGHRYLVETSVDGKTVRTSVTDKTAQTVARSKDTGFDAAFKVPGVPKTLTLFALNTSSMQYPALARLYGCQIWTGGGAKLVRDFVPCYQKSKQRYGLLDKVSGAFFSSASATGFIGSELPPEEGEGEDGEEGEPYVHEMPSDYEEIEFVAANGAQYVDTGLAAKAGLHADVDLMYTRDTSRCILGAADAVLPAPANAAIKRRYQVGTTFAAASGRTLYLFARNDGGAAADFACARIYGAKLTDGEQMVRDYVPCRKKASGVVGFFERMHGKFCPSAGKKPFFVPLRVGVYGGKGATGAVVSWYQLVDGSMECDLVNLSPSLAQDGAVFETLDVVVMPGGSSQNEYESLGADGRKNLKDFIAKGGRYYGTCAGSHLVLNDEMNLIGYKTLGAVQLHDRVNVRLNDLGKEALRLSQADWNLGYSRGPLITEGTPVEGSDLKVWATYDDEVEHTNSKGYAMNGRYAILAGTYKSGKMFVTSSHPEFYQETTPIITQGFRWLTGRDDVTLDWYGNDTVSTRPLTVFLNASYDCIHSTIETILKAVHDPRINLIKNDTSTESYKTTGKVIINPTGVLGIEATGTDANKTAIKAFKDRGGLCLFEDDGVTGEDMWTIIEGLLSDDRTEKSLAWSGKAQSFTGDQTFEGLDLRVSTTGESQTTFKDGTFSFKPNDKGLGGDWVYCADSLVHRVIIDNARVSAVYGNDRRNSYATATAEGVYSGVGVTYFEIRLGDSNTADGDAVLTFEKGLTIAAKSTIAIDARGKAPGSYAIIEAGELKLEAFSFLGRADIAVDAGRYARLVRRDNAVVLEIDESLGEVDQVDWIASTGSQYIDTGVCMQNKLTLDAEFELKSTLSSYGVLFGAYRKESSGTIYRYYFGYLKADGTWRTAIETGALTDVSGLAQAAARTRYHLVETVSGKSMKTSLNGGSTVTTSFTVGQTAHPYTCCLLAHRSGDGVTGFLPATLYGAKVYTNSTGAASGALARDYVPAYRVRSQEYGLYDRVTRTFVASASDAFAGAAVPSDPVRLDLQPDDPPAPPEEDVPELPKGYAVVEYIENTSDAYVDTGIPIQDKIVSLVDHSYTAFPADGSYMLAVNSKVGGSWGNRLYLASVNKNKSWRGGLGSADAVLLSDFGTAVLKHRYVAEASTSGSSVTFKLTDMTAGTATKTVEKTLAAVAQPDEPKTLTLFALNSSSMMYPALARLYGCQIWTDGGAKLARDYVPCYERATKKYGLWDKVSETFSPSASANGFVGPAVPEEGEGEGEDEEPKVDLSALLPDGIKCVSIVAPSSQPNSNDVVECVRALEKAGKTVKVYPGVWKRPDSGADRAREIEAAWQDLETDLILCARGGTGSYDTLKALDFEILKARDVPFMGFSNISTLLNGFVKMGVKRPIAGPLASTLATYPHTEESIRRAHAVLAREDLPSTQLEVRRAPSAAVTGKPLGGHVPSLASMTAEWIPDTTGRILFLEFNSGRNYSEAVSVFDTMASRGWFGKAAAVVLCDMGITGTAAEKENLRKYITDSVACPVFSGYTFGHVPGLLALDFGRNLTITPAGELSWGDFSETPVEPPPEEPDDPQPEPQTPVVVSAYKTLNAYLDTDAKGYIITDYIPKLAKTKIEFRLQYLADSTREKGDALCCANGFVGGSTWGYHFHVFSEDWDGLNYQNSACDDIWVGEDEGVYQIISNPDAVVTISAFRQTLTVNDLVFTGGGAIPSGKENLLASGNLVLFAYADSKKDNYDRMTKKRVYSVRIWEIDGGVTNLVKDLVPAVAADGTKTLYDKVAKKCLAPTNGGGFAVGAATETAADAGMVEPTAALGTANSAKPIEYPSAPEVAGEVGAQTIAYGGVSVNVPRHYTATVTGNTVTLALNDFAKPVIEDSDDDKKAIFVDETTVTLHVGNRIDGLFYRVITTTALGGEWTPVTEFLPEADFTVDRVKTDSAAFYKIEVSDVK